LIKYCQVGDGLSAGQKLRTLDNANLSSFDWTSIEPNIYGDWLGQRDDMFSTWPAIGTKKPEPGQITVFKVLSRGVETARDAWVYNFSALKLEANVRRLVDNYNRELPKFDAYCNEQGITKRTEATVTSFLGTHPYAADPSYIKWS